MIMSRRTTIDRKLSIYGFDSVNNGHNIYALLEFDITNLRGYLRRLRVDKKGCSLFVFMLKAIAVCLKEFPLFNSMVDEKRTTEFDRVDISVPVEIEKEGRIQNKQYLIRNADVKSIVDIEKEIEIAKNTIDEQTGYILSKSIQSIMNVVPKWLAVKIIKSIMRNHKKVMELSGSVFITSVSMFSTVPGFIIPYIGGPKASSFAIGSTLKKPVVINDKIEIREILNITAVFNHDIIDGAPAARFINRLRKMIEKEYESVL